MTLYWFDLLQACICLFACAWFWYFKEKKSLVFKGFPTGLVFISFIFTPVNITQKNTSNAFVTERKIPDKVEVRKESFENKQDAKLQKLKKESKEKRDEEIN